MRRLTGTRLCAITFIASTACLCAAGANCADDSVGSVAHERQMFDFLPSVLQLTNEPPRESHLKISCQAHIDPDNRAGGQYATVLTVEDKKALIIAFSPHKLEQPWLTMTLRGVFVPAGESHPTDRGTMDWAYVFDRNEDGAIDFFSFLVGPVWITPEGDVSSTDMPSVKQGVQQEFFDANRDKLRMAFWHLADDNYDGDHDGLMARTVNEVSGWSDGWVVVTDSNFDTRYDTCTWSKGRIDGDPQDCVLDKEEFRVPGMAVAGLASLPPPTASYLDAFNGVVEACKLDSDHLYSEPLRAGWPYERNAADLNACYDNLDLATCEGLALRNDAQAQERIGFIYANAKGVEKDDEMALQWFRKAAAQGYGVAEYNLGYMYFWGRGVPEDHAVAAVWYEKAAEQDYTLAQHVLSSLYEKGDGVAKDGGEALRWLRRAANLGYPPAQYNLGLRYAAGEGVEEDYVYAYAWWALASLGGHAKARQGIEMISKTMTRKQVKKAKKLGLEILEDMRELAAASDSQD